MYEEFERKKKIIETINKLLDKFNYLLNKVNDEEKEQLLSFMDYLETKYRKLESESLEDNKTK